MGYLVLTAGISATVASYVYRSTARMLNDVVDGFAIEIPASAFLATATFQGYAAALGLFLPLAGVGLVVSIVHFRQSSEREFASAQFKAQNERFNAALNNMTQGLCMFDAGLSSGMSATPVCMHFRLN